MPASMILAAVAFSQAKIAKPFDLIMPQTLQAHERFLASDLLEGRGTPSRGLDLAAEYIAAQFQIAGLETPEAHLTKLGRPVPDNVKGYFQVTEYENRRTKQKAPVKNVIAVLPGSDPKLQGSYILLTAHYDHLGMREGEGDQLFNGANDDASGVTGVLETARALATTKPKRSIVFMCFWGEELGLQGSRYYVQNPVFALKSTVVNVNLEQIGRTDDSEGPRVAEFNLTGFDYTDLATTMEKGAKEFGVKVTMHPKLSGPYFNASDNATFANAGVPANTISTSYSFPDYHGVGDSWEKLDYANMTAIVRSICAGVQHLANSKDVVKWNESNERTKRYVEAWKKLQDAP